MTRPYLSREGACGSPVCARLAATIVVDGKLVEREEQIGAPAARPAPKDLERST